MPEQTVTATPAPTTRPNAAPPAPQRIKPKIGHNVLTCFAIVIGVALLFVLAALYAVAKSGIVEVPLFSHFYYSPVPTRVIQAAALSPDALQEILAQQLTAQVMARRKPPYAVKLTEKELSGVAEQALDTALQEAGWKLVSFQIAVRPTDLELFGKLEHASFKLEALIRFTPRLEQGALKLDPVLIQIGDYRLPPALTYQLIGYLASRDMGAWSLKFGDTVLDGLQLHDGYLELQVASGKP